MGLDRRDPQKLGEFLLKNKRPNRPLSYTANEIEDSLWRIPDYGLNETMQTVATKAYQQELKEKAAAGDRYAQRILDEQSD